MATQIIKGVVLYFDEDTGVVTLKRRSRVGEQTYETHLMHIKLESPVLSTMSPGHQGVGGSGGCG